MKAYLAFVAVLFTSFPQIYGGGCPNLWMEHNGHCYRFFNQPRLDFSASQLHCQSLVVNVDSTCDCRSSNLVTINSYAENNFILNWWRDVRESSSGKQYVRIGYTDYLNEGSWAWASGIRSTYTNWESNQPDNRSGQDCAVMRKASSDNGEWDDEGCGNKRAFICEY